MTRIFATLCALLPLFSLQAGEIPPPEGKEVVAPDARLELLFTRRVDSAGGLTEGPAAAPDGGVYFSDILRGEDNGMILRFDPKSETTSVFSFNSHKTNGLLFDADGRMLACEGADYGGRCLSRWNIQTGKREVLADRYQGKRFNSPNDLCQDAKGRVYFTDPRYLGHEPRELEHRAVYRYDPDGTVSELTRNVSKPNGVAVSPDQKTLYVAETDNGTDSIDPNKPAKKGPMKVYAFELTPTGDVGRRRTLIDFGEENGCDGMTVDSQGRVYLTVRNEKRPGVWVLTSQGSEVAYIPTGPANQSPAQGESPVGLPSNVEFGVGDDSNTLYVTVDTSLYRIRLKSKGWHVQYGSQR